MCVRAGYDKPINEEDKYGIGFGVAGGVIFIIVVVIVAVISSNKQKAAAAKEKSAAEQPSSAVKVPNPVADDAIGIEMVPMVNEEDKAVAATSEPAASASAAGDDAPPSGAGRVEVVAIEVDDADVEPEAH